MKKKFYLDTCIWRDFFEDRKDNLKPLGEFAFQFLKKCVKNNAEIIVSDAVIFELEAKLSKENVKELFSSFGNIILNVIADHKQLYQAKNEWKKINKQIPFKDVLHAIIARDNKAVLVTRDKHFLRDKHFFEKLSSIVHAEKPENITLS